MAVPKLTTIGFLLLWQRLLPGKVLDENSRAPALQMAFVEMKIRIGREQKLVSIPPPTRSSGSDVPATWVQYFTESQSVRG